MNKNVAVFWFRRDLRLEDNVGLFHCLNEQEQVLPIFIFDKNILGRLNDSFDRRVDFIHQALTELHKSIVKSGSSLMVLHDTPLDAFRHLTSNYSISAVYTNHDYEPSAIERDTAVADFLKSKGIVFKSFKDQVIFEKSEVVKSDGTPYTIYTPYSRVWKQRLMEHSIKSCTSEKLIEKFLKLKALLIPSLQDIGFGKTDIQFSRPVIDPELIKNYHLTRNIPSLQGTTRLSVHLRFGTISIRKLVKVAMEYNEQWLNELIWREFFMSILFHFPHVVNQSFKKKYDGIKWRNNEAEFERWCNGQTGYPIVDAGMRELNETGFMHNRVRMVVASFLTKHLLIDWRWGETYFAEKLLDYELSSNNGNWQWAAGCGCDAAPYFRVFNPEEQTKRFDPEFKYIRKWVPEFCDFQYVKPLVEHKFARQRALNTYKKGIEQ